MKCFIVDLAFLSVSVTATCGMGCESRINFDLCIKHGMTQRMFQTCNHILIYTYKILLRAYLRNCKVQVVDTRQRYWLGV